MWKLALDLRYLLPTSTKQVPRYQEGTGAESALISIR